MKQFLCTLLTVILLTSFLNAQTANTNAVEQWGLYEITLEGPSEGNPFMDVNLTAEFTNGEKTVKVWGFYDGSGIYKIRFSPDAQGEWEFTTQSNVESLSGHSGKVNCIAPSGNNHGPVEVFNTFYFSYTDGTPYHQLGTTCYAWAHQGDSLEEVTLETLAASPFNKIRMTVFPKDYHYNENEPVYYPFEHNDDGSNDFTRPNPAFWHHFENRVLQLQGLGIEADIILFHPYDRWGYAAMADYEDDFYLKYALARLSAFRNVWWSAANEFDFMEMKTMGDWHRYFKLITRYDPHDRLRGIHNGFVMYDHTMPWVTHASIQSTHFDSAAVWRERWKKPLVYDECRYEGDVVQGWGNLTGEEMTMMFWSSLITGTYAGHGETYMHPEDILWWAKGGTLHGTSPERIAFFKTYLEQMPVYGYEPFDTHSAGIYGQEYIYYFQQAEPTEWSFNLPGHQTYNVEIIDTWEMTSTKIEQQFPPSFTLELPGKPYIAVKITAADFIFPIGNVDLRTGGIYFNTFDRPVLFTGTTEAELIHSLADEIRYTTDGTPVTADSKLYSSPVAIREETELRTAAFENGRMGKETVYHFEPVETQPALDVKDFSPGIEYSYYEGEWTMMPDFSTLEPVRSGVAEAIDLSIDHIEDYWGVVYEGYIKVPYDGLYTFYLTSDDGAFLILNDEKIIDNDGQHGMREVFGQTALEAGYHKIEVPYFDNWYDHGLILHLHHEKTGRIAVHSDMLFH